MKFYLPAYAYAKRKMLEDLEDGFYEARIVELHDKTTKEGKQYCRVVFLINGSKYDYLIFEESAWKATLVAEALNLKEPGKEAEIDTYEFLNKEIGVNVENGRISFLSLYPQY